MVTPRSMSTNIFSETMSGWEVMIIAVRTVRGYKTWPGMQTGLMLAGTSPA
jgi:ABC-type iron transport system FetAB permease component